MSTVTYKVPNINCNHCVHTIKTELSEVEGVKNVDASSETKQVTVTFEVPATEAVLKAKLGEINYPAV